MAKAEEFEKYFKDKINWKFFNYLIDKATVFEDQDIYFEFSVRVLNNDKTYSVYFSNKFGSKFNDKSPYDFEYIKYRYEQFGLCYAVECDSTDVSKLFVDYYESIKNKCTVISLGPFNMKLKPIE